MIYTELSDRLDSSIHIGEVITEFILSTRSIQVVDRLVRKEYGIC